MPAPKTSPTTIAILIAVYAATLVFGIMLFYTPPPVFPDPAWGFIAMRSMGHGSAFNTVVAPDPNNVAQDMHGFLSWWSPGQYMVPYLFIKLFGLNVGKAIAVTVSLCQFIGLIGFYKFTRKIGFTPMLSALCLLFIACQQFYMMPYEYYNGGEVLTFAFAGWFLYGCASIEKVDWRLSLFTLLSCLVGFFCKSSMMWVFIAGCLYMWIWLSSNKSIGDWIKNGLYIGIPAITGILLIAFLYLAKGDNPSADVAGLKFSLLAFTFPLASPLLAGFSIDDIFNGLILHTDVPRLNPTWSLVVVGVLAILSVIIVAAIVRSTTNNKYRLMLTVFYVIGVLFFTGGFLRQANISYEARHFRLIGLLVIPGALYAVGKLKTTPKVLFAIFWLGIAVFTFKSAARVYDFNRNWVVRGNSGIALPFIDRAMLDHIHALDQQHRDAIFAFISPDLAQEVQNNRVTVFDPIGPDVSINFDEYRRKGHAGPVFLMVPGTYYGPKANMLLKCFPGYKGFRIEYASDEYLLYSASEARD